MNYPHLAIVLAFYSSVLKDFVVHDPSKRLCYKTNGRYLLRRIRHEGLGFVSRSLPILGKAVEASLISGGKFICPPDFVKHWRSALPSFFYELFVELFDDDGHPLSSNTSEAIWSFFVLRQVCLAFSKAKDIPSRMTFEEAKISFSERITTDAVITAPSWLLNRARELISRVVMDEGRLHASLTQWESIPWGKHGPGAVAMKEKGLAKWNFRRIDGSDMNLYRFNDRSAPITGTAKPVSRVCIVPKDFKSLRSICIEPKEFQFAQQGLWTVLKDLIHADPLTKKSINFENQKLNADLCYRSDLATIDLKDASDTVSLKLCRLLFPKEFFSLVTRYRSREVAIDGSKVKPTCFASMGSALCFPIETLVFWAITQASIHPRSSHKPVRVFGDDIVCPKQDAPFVIKMLEACGFKANRSKCCIDTPIRESCGAFTYANNDISIVRFKNAHCQSPLAWISLTESCKLLHSSLMTNASYAMLRHLKQFWHVPFGHFGLPKSPDGFSCQSRWNAELQRREWRLPRLVLRRGKEELPGDSGLYAWLVGNSTKPSQYGLERVKIGWAADYCE